MYPAFAGQRMQQQLSLVGDRWPWHIVQFFWSVHWCLSQSSATLKIVWWVELSVYGCCKHDNFFPSMFLKLSTNGVRSCNVRRILSNPDCRHTSEYTCREFSMAKCIEHPNQHDLSSRPSCRNSISSDDFRATKLGFCNAQLMNNTFKVWQYAPKV